MCMPCWVNVCHLHRNQHEDLIHVHFLKSSYQCHVHVDELSQCRLFILNFFKIFIYFGFHHPLLWWPLLTEYLSNNSSIFLISRTWSSSSFQHFRGYHSHPFLRHLACPFVFLNAFFECPPNHSSWDRYTDVHSIVSIITPYLTLSSPLCATLPKEIHICC